MSGIPTLVLLDKRGGLISKDGRNVVTQDPSGGWIPKGAHDWGGGQRLGGPTAAPPFPTGSVTRPAGMSDEDAFQLALQQSLATSGGGPSPPLGEDEAMRRALELSMREAQPKPSTQTAAALENDLERVASSGKLDRTLGKNHDVKSLGTLQTIVQNIRNSPQNEKYRSLKKENTRLKADIFSAPGCTEFLQLVGFDDCGSHLVLPHEALDVGLLNMALEVISRRIAVAKLPKAPKKEVDPRRAAVLARMAADRKEAATRTYKDSTSKHKGFGAGRGTWKSATDIGAAGSSGGG